MSRRIVMVTKTDFLRLSALLHDGTEDDDVALALEEKLSRAAIVEPRRAPSDLVTMNSRLLGTVRLGGTGPREAPRTYTLVYPREADISEGRISIFAPLGAELLGVRAGQEATWTGRDGAKRTLLVDEVLYQPEATGDWHL